MQENLEPMELNERLTDVDITWAIRYLDPDLGEEKAGGDASTVVEICTVLFTALAGVLTYIYLYMREL